MTWARDRISRGRELLSNWFCFHEFSHPWINEWIEITTFYSSSAIVSYDRSNNNGENLCNRNVISPINPSLLQRWKRMEGAKILCSTFVRVRDRISVPNSIFFLRQRLSPRSRQRRLQLERQVSRVPTEHWDLRRYHAKVSWSNHRTGVIHLWGT